MEDPPKDRTPQSSPLPLLTTRRTLAGRRVDSTPGVVGSELRGNVEKFVVACLSPGVSPCPGCTDVRTIKSVEANLSGRGQEQRLEEGEE